MIYDDYIAELRSRTDAWRTECHGRKKEFKESFRTLSGIPIEPLYTPEHLTGMDYLRDLGFPGEPPYIRGVHPTMYRGRTWTHRQLAGFGPPEETNKRYKFLLDQGATGINGVYDYPTLRGYDSDGPEARADVGRGRRGHRCHQRHGDSL
jgi:methylmalonyl-CoA mutase N-terminal domain/subunit